MRFLPVILILPLTLLLNLFGNAQQKRFVGSIRYDIYYVTQSPDLPGSVIKAALGSKQTLHLYKGGFCKEMNQPMGWKKQWYDNEESRLYFIQSGFDTLYWMNTSNPDDSIVGYETEENAGEVLGHRCHLLTAQTAEETIRYFYSPDYYFPGDPNSSFQFEASHAIQQITKAPYLKLEMTKGPVTTTYIASEIVRRCRVPRKIRRLPQDLPLREWK